MHEFRMPMRWSDLDPLRHVNNVLYVDYAGEARYALLQEGLIPDLPVARMSIEFLAPMQLSRKDIIVRSEIKGPQIVQEIVLDKDESPIHARVRTHLAVRSDIESAHVTANHFPLRVRRSDVVTADGNASKASIVEYVQEARVNMFGSLYKRGIVGEFVVAAIDVEFGGAIAWRPEPYDVYTGVQRVGTSSVRLVTEVKDKDVVLAQAIATVVGFDAGERTSRRFSDAEREALESLAAKH